VPCCAVLCCAVLCCAVLCCAVPCCAVGQVTGNNRHSNQAALAELSSCGDGSVRNVACDRRDEKTKIACCIRGDGSEGVWDSPSNNSLDWMKAEIDNCLR